MADRVFLDTGFLYAVTFPEPPVTEFATALLQNFKGSQLITCQEVLLEFLTLANKAQKKSGAKARKVAIEAVEGLLNNVDIEVIEQTPVSFLNAKRTYKERPDKRYSSVDCCIIHHMRERGIKVVFTTDGEFSQEGAFASPLYDKIREQLK